MHYPVLLLEIFTPLSVQTLRNQIKRQYDLSHIVPTLRSN